MFLPEFDREYLAEKGYEFQEEADHNLKGVIIKKWALPENKFTLDQSDLLIFLPDGYPDVSPDMFYFFPALLLRPTNRYPRATEAFQSFKGANWQRWSRHLDASQWRRGVDGIHTYLRRVDEALRAAS
jgi:hypothetical protein